MGIRKKRLDETGRLNYCENRFGNWHVHKLWQINIGTPQ